MISILFPETLDNNTETKISVSGHAFSANKGNDVVCSAVSTLLQTLLAGLELVCDAQITGVFETGNCDVEIKVPASRQRSFLDICKVFRFGFRKIRDSYPEYIEFDY